MEQTKREILKFMGIDVWQLRQVSRREAPILIKIPMSKVRVSRAPAQDHNPETPANLPVAKEVSVATKQATVKKMEDWHFEVLYLVSGDFAMIIDREDYRGVSRRLADDLLRMLGDPKTKPEPVSFRWPQRSTGSRESALGAWSAFIERKFETTSEITRQLLVVESELCRQLIESITLKFHWIPKLDQLLASGQAKKELWQVLKSPS